MLMFSFVRYFLATFAVALLLASCSNFRKDSFSSALLDIGQLFSYEKCKDYGNPKDYQECIVQVDKNYDEAKQRSK